MGRPSGWPKRSATEGGTWSRWTRPRPSSGPTHARPTRWPGPSTWRRRRAGSNCRSPASRTSSTSSTNQHTWTCGKGVYAGPVAELALTLGLAGLRGLGTYARADSWTPPQGTNLLGGRVTILGGGGITESLVRPAAAVELPHHGRPPQRARHRRRGRRAGGRPLCRRPPGRRPRRPGAGADARHRGHHRRRRAGADGRPRLARQRGPWTPRRDRRPRRRVARRRDRRRRPRRHGPGAAAGRPPAVVAAQLHHHAARRQHPGDGGAAAGPADHGERPPVRPPTRSSSARSTSTPATDRRWSPSWTRRRSSVCWPTTTAGSSSPR